MDGKELVSPSVCLCLSAQALSQVPPSHGVTLLVEEPSPMELSLANSAPPACREPMVPVLRGASFPGHQAVVPVMHNCWAPARRALLGHARQQAV